jgi:hypothetical protein
VYVGASSNAKNPVVGVADTTQVLQLLRHDVEAKITPPLDLTMDVQESEGKNLIRIQVPRSKDPPCAIDGSKIYVRSEGETNLAVRDEIVELVKRALDSQPRKEVAVRVADTLSVSPPRTGVEIAESEERKGKRYYTMCDLRKGNRVQNVTRSSARRLWHYAIVEAEKKTITPQDVQWHGEIGLIKDYKQSGHRRFDLAQRSGNKVRVYYGVSEEGLHGEWKALVGLDED